MAKNQKSNNPFLNRLTIILFTSLLLINVAHAITFEKRVSQSTDDAEEVVATGQMYLVSTDLELVDDNGNYGEQYAGIRFQNIIIPQGATITNAYIEFETDEVTTVSTTLTFYGEDTDNAPVFNSTASNISSRTQTTASVDWSTIPAWNTLNEKHQSPDLSSVVQEIVDRGGWASGNSMVFIVDGSGERVAESYDGESTAAPLLHVEYSETPVAYSNYTWPFTTAGNYTYDSGIEVTGGYGQLTSSISGAIENSIVDSLIFDTAGTNDPNIIHISGDVYAVVYDVGTADGYIETFTIDSTGQISAASIDTQIFDSAKAKTVKIIHISGNVYGVYYSGDGDDGYLKTYTIATNGQITNTAIDSLEFDVQKGKEADMINISGDVYAIQYSGDGDDGYLKTFTIATNGQITDTAIDTLEFDTAKGKGNEIIHISGDTYALLYSGDGDDGMLKTVTIATNGQITDSIIDSLEFNVIKGITPEMINISGDVYAIAYDDGAGAYVNTYTIAANGQITDTPIDTQVVDNSDGLNPQIIHLTDNIYAISYGGADDDGFIKTYTIATNGQITNTPLDTLEYDTINALDNSLLKVDTNILALAFQGNGDDGTIKTIELSTSYPSNNPTIRPDTSNSVAYTDLASFTTIESLDGGSISYQITNDGANASPTWYYWNGSNWVTAGAVNYNSAAVVNANISQFITDVGTGDFSVKAFLISDGTQNVKLDNVGIAYQFTNAYLIINNGIKIKEIENAVKRKFFD